MSRLCRLKTKTHGADGQWAYEEITRLRELLREARDEMRAMERLHNGYYASLEKIDEALK
jgi:hypothetical protein